MSSLRPRATPVQSLEHCILFFPQVLTWINLVARLAELCRHDRLELVNINFLVGGVLNNSYQSCLQIFDVLPASHQFLQVVIKAIL